MSVVKEENVVFVGGVRLWKTETLSREPTGSEKETDIGKLWYFFLELVGHDVDNQIQKLEIVNLNGTSTKCECEAALEGDETKSKHPCSCSGAGGIITFKSSMAAGKLKKQLSDHKGWHTQGLVDRGKIQADGSVEFCPHCCFNNKQIKYVNRRPVAGGVFREEDPEE